VNIFLRHIGSGLPQTAGEEGEGGKGGEKGKKKGTIQSNYIASERKKF